MDDASQVEADFAATPIDGMAFDALLRLKEFGSPRGVTRNYGQHRSCRHDCAKRHTQTDPRPKTHTSSMSCHISRMQHSVIAQRETSSHSVVVLI